MSIDENVVEIVRDKLAQSIREQLHLSEADLVLIPLPGSSSKAEQYSIEISRPKGALTIDVSGDSIEVYDDECIDNPQTVDLSDPSCSETLEKILSSFGFALDLKDFLET